MELNLRIKETIIWATLPQIVGVVFIMFCLISASHSAPISSDPWWCQPCKMQHRTRHSRAINELVKNQFNAALVNYRNIISKYIEQIHAKLQIDNITKKQIKKNNWLPRKKFFRSLQKDNEKILPELLYQIQVYAVTFEKLSRMEIRSADALFNMKERKNVLRRVKSDINLLRCETEYQIRERQLVITKKVPVNLVDSKIPDSVGHLTEGLLKDYSILKDYHNFLKKCYNKIFGKTKKNRKRLQKGNNKVKSQKRTLKNSINKKVSES